MRTTWLLGLLGVVESLSRRKRLWLALVVLSSSKFFWGCSVYLPVKEKTCHKPDYSGNFCWSAWQPDRITGRVLPRSVVSGAFQRNDGSYYLYDGCWTAAASETEFLWRMMVSADVINGGAYERLHRSRRLHHDRSRRRPWQVAGYERTKR